MRLLSKWDDADCAFQSSESIAALLLNRRDICFKKRWYLVLNLLSFARHFVISSFCHSVLVLSFLFTPILSFGLSFLSFSIFLTRCSCHTFFFVIQSIVQSVRCSLGIRLLFWLFVFFLSFALYVILSPWKQNRQKADRMTKRKNGEIGENKDWMVFPYFVILPFCHSICFLNVVFSS